MVDPALELGGGGGGGGGGENVLLALPTFLSFVIFYKKGGMDPMGLPLRLRVH